MKAIGETTKRMGKVDSYTLTEMSTKDNELKTKLMDKGTTLTWMEQSTWGIEERISSMDKEWRLGLTERDTKAIMLMGRNMEMGSSTEQTEACMMETSMTTTSMEKESMPEAMGGSM